MARLLTEKEIEEFLDFIVPNPLLPPDVANQQVKNQKRLKREQLQCLKVNPRALPAIKKEAIRQHHACIITNGESSGVIAAQSVGEKSTQANLNTFHTPGAATNIATRSSNFEELINATKEPTRVTGYLYFKDGNETIGELRKQLGHSLVELNLSKFEESYRICLDKKDEPWYDMHYTLFGDNEYNDCISVKIKMSECYEYQLTLGELAELVSAIFPNEMYVVHSPDCFGQLDIFMNTDKLVVPDKIKHLFVNDEGHDKAMLLEDVAYAAIRNTRLCGIEGVQSIRYIKHNENGQRWSIETTGLSLKKHNTFRDLLAFDNVVFEKTIISNIWNVFGVLGVEATRQHMINCLTELLVGINYCHILLIVDQMTFGGSILSMTRHTVLRDTSNSGPIAVSTFETAYAALLGGAAHGYLDPCNSISAQIVISTDANIGTNAEFELFHVMP